MTSKYWNASLSEEQVMARMKAEMETNQERTEAKMNSHYEELMAIIKSGQEETGTMV
jgi:hypothetical protein